LVCRNNTFIL